MTPFSSPKARRLGLMLALCLAIEASAPAPASAWFGWVDRWSGPGPFWGELYEVRVLCFGDSAPPPQEIARLAADARAASPLTFTQSWNSLADDLEKVGRAFGLPEVIELAKRTRQATSSNANALLIEVEKAINSQARKAAALGGSGVFLSFCSPDKSRRFSVELNMNYWRNKRRDPEYAGGEDISMYTFMPTVTANVFEKRKLDVLDVGFGAGRYLFRSAGFEDFTGWIFEPRVDLHFPTSWSDHPRNHPKRIFSMLSLRAGYMISMGFDADDFAATGSKAVKIPREATPTFAVFVNLNSLLTSTIRILPPSARTGGAKP